MLFVYKTVNEKGAEVEGTIEAINIDVAIGGLQQRGLVISDIRQAEEGSIFSKRITFLERVSNKDVVIMSRQIATLFSAQVSALKIFRLLAAETENPKLRDTLNNVATDLQGGSSLAKAMEKESKVFSAFYINMVRAGEESGKLEDTFMSLADYLDRMYELTAKAKHALIYPTFVVFTFFTVMTLMLTIVIPKLATIIKDSGQEIPVYTQVVMGLSDFLVAYGIFFLIGIIIVVFFLIRYGRTETGKQIFSRLKITVPFFGSLYRKLYLSRLADNMHTMLESGIPMVKAIEITGSVVDNKIFEGLLLEAVEKIKGGKPVSEALGEHKEIPSIMIQMIRVGEETGELGNILATLSKFYRREVNGAVDTLVDMIEPAMIVLLGLGVGSLLASILVPIYNISGGF